MKNKRYLQSFQKLTQMEIYHKILFHLNYVLKFSVFKYICLVEVSEVNATGLCVKILFSQLNYVLSSLVSNIFFSGSFIYCAHFVAV